MALNSKKIAVNTAWLYLRMIFILLVSLYTSRVILNALGIVDYGIYNVVGGVVALLGFLKSSLSGATARFLAFELGRNDAHRLKSTFVASFNLHLWLSVFVFIVLETIGLWFVQNKLEVPEDRYETTILVYHLSVLASIIHIMQVPYNSVIIAREKMIFFSIIGVVDALLKLSIAYGVGFCSYDKLAFYGCLVTCESIFVLLCYHYYCKRNFPECMFSLKTDKEIVQPMLSFSGWDLYGNLSVVVRSQGLNILQNTFFGPIVNAATGISNQVMSGIMGFADNFLTAIKPQVIKLYAENKISDFIKLILSSSKLSFFLLIIVSAPLMAETEYVLRLWLVQVPDWTIPFCQLSIVNNWASILFRPVIYAIHATGYAKRISLINGTIYILVLPMSYLFLRLGASPIVPFVLNIVLLLVGHTIFSLTTLHRYLNEFHVTEFIMKVIAPSFILAFLCLLPSACVNSYMEMSVGRFLLNSFCSSGSAMCLCWIFLLSTNEKRAIKNKILYSRKQK